MIDPIFNWLNGITALIVVIGAWLYAILNLRRYLTKGKVLNMLYMTILAIAIAMGWTGITLSFFSVLIFGYTLPEVAAIISYFSYSTIPIGSCAVILISWDLLFTPKNKKIGLAIFGAFYAIYYVFLFLTWNQTVMVSNVPGQIFDDWLAPTSVSFWMIWVIVGASAVLWAIGFDSFRKKSTGELQKRGVYLFLVSFFLGGAILLDTVVFIGALGEFAWIARLLMTPAVYMGYKGLSPI